MIEEYNTEDKRVNTIRRIVKEQSDIHVDNLMKSVQSDKPQYGIPIMLFGVIDSKFTTFQTSFQDKVTKKMSCKVVPYQLSLSSQHESNNIEKAPYVSITFTGDKTLQSCNAVSPGDIVMLHLNMSSHWVKHQGGYCIIKLTCITPFTKIGPIPNYIARETRNEEWKKKAGGSSNFTKFQSRLNSQTPSTSTFSVDSLKSKIEIMDDDEEITF